MQKTVSLCSPSQSRDSGLVRNISQKNIQMVFEHQDIPMVAVSQVNGEEIEQLGTLYCQGTISGFLHTGRC